MDFLNYAPDGWSPERLAAFNALLSALLAYMVLDYVMGKLGDANPIDVQRRQDVGALITGRLLPAFRAA